MASTDLTAERLRELLHYDLATGVFTRIARRNSNAKIGDQAGSLRADGYHIIRLDNKIYRTHRLAWLYVHSRWPDKEIDHVNGKRTDNWIANLREATRSENQQNLRHQTSRSTSGFLGVSWHKARMKWIAQIKIDGQKHYLGYFSIASEAHAAYIEAKRMYHPFAFS